MQLDLVCNIFSKIPNIHSFILFIVLIRSGWWPQDLIIKSDKKRWESVVWCNRHRHHMAPVCDVAMWSWSPGTANAQSYCVLYHTFQLGKISPELGNKTWPGIQYQWRYSMKYITKYRIYHVVCDMYVV